MSFKDIIRDAEEGSWKRPRKQLYYGLVDNDVNYPSWFFFFFFFFLLLIDSVVYDLSRYDIDALKT